MELFNVTALDNVFFALIIVLLASPVNKLLLIVLKYAEKNLVEKTKTKVDDIIFDLVNKFAGIIIYIIAAILALDILGINVMPFVAGAGVLGVGDDRLQPRTPRPPEERATCPLLSHMIPDTI